MPAGLTSEIVEYTMPAGLTSEIENTCIHQLDRLIIDQLLVFKMCTRTIYEKVINLFLVFISGSENDITTT